MPEVTEQQLYELLMQVRRDIADLKARLHEVGSEIHAILKLMEERKSR